MSRRIRGGRSDHNAVSPISQRQQSSQTEKSIQRGLTRMQSKERGLRGQNKDQSGDFIGTLLHPRSSA
jgi:hypothetical protein